MSEFFYRVRWRAGGVYPGAHPGRQAGAGLLFRWHVPLLQHPDPRRIDLRASLLDPFQNCQVRVQEQRASIPVFVLLDLSASMGYQGRRGKLAVAAEFLMALANSAHRLGDAVGLAAFADGGRPLLYQPLSRQPGVLRELAARLARQRPAGGSARGLARAGRFLPAGRSLVFLLSDFHYPLALLRQVMAGLARHQVVPVVLWDGGERAPGQSGLAALRDLESGQERLLWLRPQLRERLQASFRERRARLVRLLRRSGCEPVFMEDGFDAEALSRHFLEGA